MATYLATLEVIDEMDALDIPLLIYGLIDENFDRRRRFHLLIPNDILEDRLKGVKMTSFRSLTFLRTV
ncbi:hypothetical protein GJAV_G00076810 [Gymnothorax javanicus]|nr:hypothetical protein GJAV_G00076810 [Gymnothorax javanicus]